MPTPGTDEQRPLGIPPIADRATPGVVQHALEAAREAPCAPTSGGFRPGRSPWEARGALDGQSNQNPTWVLEADLATCVDGIDHAAV